jgi:UDP-4-amino-4,6-dideoxy-N-acetyl-beta-L-altrosamine transaminase
VIDQGAHFLPYGHQCVDEDDIDAVVSVLRGDWLTTGPAVEEFERAIAERVGARFAVACNSGTAGLHLAAMALGVASGTTVVPAITFVATANVARHAGAEIAFADVDPDTGLMGVTEVDEAVQRVDRPLRAVMPVHLAGQCADMAAIAGYARDRAAVVIEDACHAIGGHYRADGELLPIGCCRHSAVTVFSFHPVKTITMGEGGVATTNDPDLYERMRSLRNHGLSRDPQGFSDVEAGFSGNVANPWYYEMATPGFNYRASDILCALGLSQLGKLDQFITRRAEIVALYDAAFAKMAPRLKPLGRAPGCEPAWHLYIVLIDFKACETTRAAVMAALRDRSIGSQVHYIPVHRQPYYRQRYPALSLTGSDAYYARTLSLPLYPGMSDTDVQRVVTSLDEVLCGTAI